MSISGKNLIAGFWTGDTEGGFTAFNPTLNQPIAQPFADATVQDVNTAIACAHEAFVEYSQSSAMQRSKFLRCIGEQILALGDELVITAAAETGLHSARIEGERGRTVGQLNLFANLLEQGEYQPVIDQADPTRQPLPKPETRLGYLPLGVVAVFAASNFPLAFSTAGGDTASALAAGCPVVMKAHTAHPATAELVAQAIDKAIRLCHLHPGVFSLIQGKNYAIASQIVSHPQIKAVGFTGSQRVGMILQQQINARPEPIPFYGELGSVNPQFICPVAMAERGETLAQGLVASMMMGMGQFCTSPGIWVGLAGKEMDMFIEAAGQYVTEQAAGVMLTPAIADSYRRSVANWQQIPGVRQVASGQQGESHQVSAALFVTDLATFAQHAELQEEVFGACALIVECKDSNELQMFISLLAGNLTASIHADPADESMVKQLLPAISHKVGRLIYNQMPTGVEVCASMNHGGPFPASTNVRTTSVGSEAIKRFQRPICYQNLPMQLLPELLQD